MAVSTSVICTNTDVAAIVVTFNPSIEKFISLVDELSKQVNKVIIIDNNSSNIDIWRVEINIYPNIELILLNDNVGIAKAQNLGIKRSMELCRYSVFFDQDSTVADDLLDKLKSSFLSLAASNPTAAVGPVFTDTRYHFYYKLIKINKYGFRKKIAPTSFTTPFEVSCIISSGMFVDNNIFPTVGLMKEEFFIDYVDTEWCLRAVYFGYKIWAIPSAVMEHEIGDAVISLLGFHVPVHTPARRFYRVRNGFYLLGIKHIPNLLAIREIFFSFISQCILVFSQRNRWLYLSNYIKAVKNAIQGIL